MVVRIPLTTGGDLLISVVDLVNVYYQLILIDYIFHQVINDLSLLLAEIARFQLATIALTESHVILSPRVNG